MLRAKLLLTSVLTTADDDDDDDDEEALSQAVHLSGWASAKIVCLGRSSLCPKLVGSSSCPFPESVGPLALLPSAGQAL